MSEQIANNVQILSGAFDISGDMNQVLLDMGVDTPDNTRFNDDTRVFAAGGLETFTVGGSGFWEGGTDAVDESTYNAIGGAVRPVTVVPSAGLDGDLAYTMQAVKNSYQTGGNIGDILPFSFGAVAGGDRLVRGTIMATGAKTATGNGTARQLGAVAAGQKLYAALHVLDPVTGTSPTLDVVVESDDNAGMTSATTRLTFTQATGKTSEWLSLAGAITDDYWRITYTIGGTSPSIPFVVVLGIR